MVAIFYGADGCQRKRDHAHTPTQIVSEAAGAPCPADEASLALPPALGAFIHAIPAVRAALLSAFGRDGAAVELNELVAAIPDHPQPLSAILELVDAGVIALDTASPFDGGLRLWRTAC